MNSTRLEDLANEILFDIFEYLRPIDKIKAFRMLNVRFRKLITKQPMHVDLSRNISLIEFNYYFDQIFPIYSSCINSIRLSNIGTCGGIKLFLTNCTKYHTTFPSLSRMSIIEPNPDEYQKLLQFHQLESIHIKFNRMYDQQIHRNLVFNLSNLETCILSYDDILYVHNLQRNIYLKRLILDGFYLNDLHIIMNSYPSLEYLVVNRLMINFDGFLPMFNRNFHNIHTLKFNCVYTVRFDYLSYVLSHFPHLSHLTVIAFGIDYFSSERWSEILKNLHKLSDLVLDLKAVSSTSDDTLLSAFLTEYWREWRIAVDYSQDNNKYHLFTVPYHRSTFISTIHCWPIIREFDHCFSSVKDLYLKANMPMEKCVQRYYNNVRALQLYRNVNVPINYSNLAVQIRSMIDTYRLVHFELFIIVPSIVFLSILQLTPNLRFFKTDYTILMIVTDDLQNNDVCSHLNNKLNKFVMRHDLLPISDHERFLQIFSQLEHLQINLKTMKDVALIVPKFIRTMLNLITFKILLNDNNNNSMRNVIQSEWKMYNVSYEISKKFIQIWK